MKTSRRTFLHTTTALTSAAALSGFSSESDKTILTHHVFFWLKKSDSPEDRNKLIEGLRSLQKIEGVRQIHIGIPADTEKRPVVDTSYSVSELIFFDDVAGQNKYQDHPIHKKFVENYSSLWEKVVVYDSIDI